MTALSTLHGNAAPVQAVGDGEHQADQRRGRAIESGITAEYLSLLDELYDEWLRNFDLCPVLTVSSKDLNFVEKAEHLDIVLARIEQTLAGKDELVLDD